MEDCWLSKRFLKLNYNKVYVGDQKIKQQKLLKITSKNEIIYHDHGRFETKNGLVEEIIGHMALVEASGDQDEEDIKLIDTRFSNGT